MALETIQNKRGTTGARPVLLDGEIYINKETDELEIQKDGELLVFKKVTHKVYRALITQTGNDTPPSVIVLENSLGAAVDWTSQGGIIHCAVPNGFDNTKTIATLNNFPDASNGISFYGITEWYYRAADGKFDVRISGNSPEGGTYSDSFVKVPFELRVYP